MNVFRESTALFDWDGTIYPGFTLLPWSRYLNEEGIFPSWAFLEIEHLFRSYEIKTVDYKLLCERSASTYALGLDGKRLDEVSELASRFVDSEQQNIYAYARHLFEKFDSEGITTTVVSGAPSIVLREYSRRFLINEVFGLDVSYNEQGRFSGKVTNNPGLAKQKALAVSHILEKRKVWIAFGDNLADLPLFEAAAIGILLKSSTDVFPDNINRRLLSLNPEHIEAAVIQIMKDWEDLHGHHH